MIILGKTIDAIYFLHSSEVEIETTNLLFASSNWMLTQIDFWLNLVLFISNSSKQFISCDFVENLNQFIPQMCLGYLFVSIIKAIIHMA